MYAYVDVFKHVVEVHKNIGEKSNCHCVSQEVFLTYRMAFLKLVFFFLTMFIVKRLLIH